jgi:predicted nucleic acid-binding protein
VSQPSRGPVVIDTSVYSLGLDPRGHRLVLDYRPVLEGRPAIISFITVAEMRFGSRIAGWGTSRLQRLDHELGRARIVWPGHDLLDEYVKLRTWCVKNGHGLGHKEHEADRWIAATAIRLGVPLVAHDAIFAGTKNLQLISRLSQA